MTTRYGTTLRVKLAVCEFAPETPFMIIVSLPDVALALALRIKVTFKLELPGNCTGLVGMKLTVIPAGDVPLRDTGSPLGANECAIVRTTISV